MSSSYSIAISHRDSSVFLLRELAIFDSVPFQLTIEDFEPWPFVLLFIQSAYRDICRRYNVITLLAATTNKAMAKSQGQIIPMSVLRLPERSKSSMKVEKKSECCDQLKYLDKQDERR